MPSRNTTEIPFGVLWRKALVSLPRLVPTSFIKYTSPDGPQPVLIYLPSRGSYQIPVYVFIPPSIYTEKNSPGKQTDLLPVLVDFHGGGFVLGSCPEQAPFCAKFARDIQGIAITVDYRMGPYATFPAALEDAEDVVHAVMDPTKSGYDELRKQINLAAVKANPDVKAKHQTQIDLDTSRIALSGFSSGGNIILNLALSLPPAPPVMPEASPSPIPSSHPRRIPLLLFFPSFDARQLPSERARPDGLAAPSKWLTALRLEDELMPTYLPRELAGHPRASPGLNAVQHLHARAKMLLVLPQFDTLAEQSEVWVQKVGSEGRGADLTVERCKGARHGWTQFPDSWLSEEHRALKAKIFDRTMGFVREAWEEQVE